MVFFTEQDLHTSKNTQKQKKKQLFMIFTLLSF